MDALARKPAPRKTLEVFIFDGKPPIHQEGGSLKQSVREGLEPLREWGQRDDAAIWFGLPWSSAIGIRRRETGKKRVGELLKGALPIMRLPAYPINDSGRLL
jgi:hypothetical protein